MATAADSGTCGATGSSVNWAYDSTSKTLTLTGTGATKSYGTTVLNRPPWYSVKTAITTVKVGEGITSIGQLNFYGCTSLTSVSLPSTLTEIDGGTANYGAFRECTALQNITLPSNLETLEDMAFRGCTALKSITFPDSLTTIGSACFRDCTSLETVTFGNGLTSTGVETFYDSGVKYVNFSPSITAIDGWSFFNTKIVSIEIPETVTSIGIRSFSNCTFMLEATVHNPNCDYGGIQLINEGKDPFNGASSYLTMYGHSLSTTQTYAESKGYNFVSIDECGHESTHEVITLEPTCTETGITTQVCDDCGFVVSETELAAKGHIYELTETNDESENDGHIYRYYKCTACGDEKQEIEHVSFIDGFYTETVITQGSCTTTGISRRTCTVEGCGKSETVITPRGNHQVETYTVVTEPTCTTAGSEEGVCSACGETITQTIDALGHEDELVSTEVNADNGHTYDTYQCTVCGAKTVTSTHNEWIDGYYSSTVITNPTCTVNGVRRDTCNICGETRLVTLQANGEHDYQFTSRTEPTCTAKGSILYTCSVCGRTRTENIDALGHDYQDVNVEISGKPGHVLTTPTCSRCGSTQASTTVHQEWVDGYYTTTVVTEGSCTIARVTRDTCNICGTTRTNTEPSPGHSYTCNGLNESGNFTYTCSTCSGTTTRTPTSLKLIWNTNYINKAPDDPSITSGIYFDVNNDGLLNAKDFAFISKAAR